MTDKDSRPLATLCAMRVWLSISWSRQANSRSVCCLIRVAVFWQAFGRLYIEDGKYDPNHKLTGIEHLEHCYDALRQSLMCSADITPLPWVWSDKAQEAKEVARVTHTCRDFDVLRNWAREHAVHHFDKKIHAHDDLNDHQ